MRGLQHSYLVIMYADNVNNDISGGRRGATLLIFVDDQPNPGDSYAWCARTRSLSSDLLSGSISRRSPSSV